MSSNRPVHTLRYGTISLAIFENTASPWGRHYALVPSRHFPAPNAENKWTKTNSFGENDALLLAKALLDAHSWIVARKAQQKDLVKLPAFVEEDEKDDDVTTEHIG